MARRRDPEPGVIVRRDFTAAELARIRTLTAVMHSWGSVELRRQTDELEAIHAAAGRRRGFMIWDWDPPHDPESAFKEEVANTCEPLDPSSMVPVRPFWWPAGAGS